MKLEAKVRCGGAIHRVLLTNGALSCPDHPGVTADTLARAETAAQAIGTSASRCGEVIQAWLSRDSTTPSKLPAAFTDAWKEAAQKGRLRRCVSPKPLLPLRERLPIRVRELASWALNEASYRRSTSKWAGGEHSCDVAIGRSCSCSGWGEKVWSDNGKWSGNNSYLKVTVPLRWLSLYVEGLALVDGILILDKIETYPNGVIEVWAVKQGRGFDINDARAWLIPSEEGHRLSWKEPKRRK